MRQRTYGTIDKPRVEAAIRDFLAAIGEDPDREGLIETPNRVARACEELFSGTQEDPSRHLIKQFHIDGQDGMVVVKDIHFYSMCEHHILPFEGNAHVVYIPKNGKITGLSKIARCVNGYARRLQVQERLTSEIADAMMEVLDPQGVFVVVEATHMCMTSRGIKKPGSLTTTSSARGYFEQETQARSEALNLIKQSL